MLLSNNKRLIFQGETLDDVPMIVIEDCAQLVKANSIQGIKHDLFASKMYN